MYTHSQHGADATKRRKVGDNKVSVRDTSVEGTKINRHGDPLQESCRGPGISEKQLVLSIIKFHTRPISGCVPNKTVQLGKQRYMLRFRESYPCE
ncbi:hypothetical protein D915_009957 [Fasciola hepatica]|uniref:Uncharacterized protein n=1 Tax=Fasciola hepatica TaxID=6192 RepID=A0A4E0QWI3_FASHE|nr:hypothetical protein D915_009957 [Fasciola hepatica]